MTRAEAIYCMKANSILHSEICEECPLYGDTGVDHCFEEALYEAIKALEQEPCKDAISREDALMALTGKWTDSTDELIYRFIRQIRTLPSVNPQPKTGWIPVKWHTITDEEREREGYPKEWVNHVDCIMPEDGEKILITVKGHNGQRWVEKDICYIDDGFYLDSGYDWVEDVEAWMPLPEPYDPQESEESE